MELTIKDLKILVEMRKNARAQLTDISKKTSIPISTIYDRLRLNTKKTIIKNASILNFEKLGFNTVAAVCLKCGKNSKKEVFEYLSHHQNINSLYKINNGFDYMIEVIFKNVRNLEEFVENIEEKYTIKAKQIFYIIDNIKKEEFLTSEAHLGIV